MKLLAQAQREQLLDNGRRQAAVKGTPAEIDFHPVVIHATSSCVRRAAAAGGRPSHSRS
jgi:hypothetical protein